MPHTPLIETLAAELARRARAPRYWIAYSGGLDSTVLAHVCHTIRCSDGAYDFAAVHIHHGLHPDAGGWTRHAEQQCRSLQLPLEIRHVDARPAPGQSLEASARAARYAAFAALLQPNEVLLTAQHQNDQAETLLIQLLRGAGPAGLAAMPAWAPLGRGYLARPLLAIARRVLEEHAAQHGLCWVDDPSNDDSRFTRNYLRRQILPRLQTRWPAVAATLSRSARHCAEADELLTELGNQLLAEVHEPARNTLRLDSLSALSSARQRLVLRHWFLKTGCAPPSSRLIARILDELIPARDDRQPAIDWNGATIRRFRGELYLVRPLPPFDRTRSTVWSAVDASITLPCESGALRAQSGVGPGIDPRHWCSSGIEVRFRQGGESIVLPGRRGARTLKKLLQEADLAPWLRERLPLIYLNGQLAAIADLHVAAPFAGDPTAANVSIVWQRPDYSLP